MKKAKKVKYKDKDTFREHCSRCGSFDIKVLSCGTILCSNCGFVNKPLI